MSALEVGARVRVVAAYSVHDGATGDVIAVDERAGIRTPLVQLDGVPTSLWFGEFEVELVDQLTPTASADAGEVVHWLCTTCWPSYADGERFALCGADMRDEREVASVGPAERCQPCAAASWPHVHDGARRANVQGCSTGVPPIDSVPGVPRAPRVDEPDTSCSQAGLGTYRHRYLLAPADDSADRQPRADEHLDVE